MDNQEVLIRSIVARAAPMAERVRSTALTPSAADLEKAQRRLERWQNILGSQDLLSRRLRSGDLPPEPLDFLWSSEQTDAGLPSWATAFSAIAAGYTWPSALRNGNDRSFDATDPLPFQEILAGFVHYAREQLTTVQSIRVLSPAAVIEAEHQLLSHLTFLASLTFGRDFYAFRFDRAPLSAIESVWCRQAASTELYDAYVAQMLQGGLLQFFHRFPVLARLLSQSVEQWIKTIAAFCQRFSADFDSLRTFFDWKTVQPAGVVAHLRTDLSDRHQQGQTVMACVLSTGERVVYKPRTVRPEIAFYTFLEWLNAGELSLKLKTIRILDRDTYGWMETIAAVPCTSETEVAGFYTRAGMLLGVFHLLAITDIHFENLIAHGEHPVAVDLETLLDEAEQEGRTFKDPPKAVSRFAGATSVLRTGLLPQWQDAADGRQYDMSGLGADESQDAGVRVFTWLSVNTDQMMLTEDLSTGVSSRHRVQLGEGRPSLLDHLPALLAGFKTVYAYLLHHRENLLSNAPLLHCFDNLELRILVRSTDTYARLQLYLLHPEFMQDGLDRSIELEWLARPLMGTKRPRQSRQLLYELERTAMENLDVPHFSTRSWKNRQVVMDDPGLLFLYRERDARILRSRLAKLSPADCARQLAVIEKAVRGRFGVRRAP